MFNNKEIYGVVEFQDNKVLFLVGMYHKSNIKILYKNHIETNAVNNGVVENEKLASKALSSLVNAANKKLKLDIKRISINIPTELQSIRRTEKSIYFEVPKNINNHDIDQLISMTKDVPSDNNSEVFFIKPYRYILDNNRRFAAAPIDNPANKITVYSVVYMTNKDVLEGQLNVLKMSKLGLLSYMPEAFALGWDIASTKHLKKGIVLIDWNDNFVNISTTFNNTVCDIKTFKFGLDHLIKKISKFLSCEKSTASDYLYKIINLNNDKDDQTIVYSKYFRETKEHIKFTHHELIAFVKNILQKNFEEIYKHLKPLIEKYKSQIIITGNVLNIGGFQNFSSLFSSKFKNLAIYISDNIGAKSFEWLALTGNIHYQHIFNKTSNSTTQSIDVNEHVKPYNLNNDLLKNENSFKNKVLNKLWKNKNDKQFLDQNLSMNQNTNYYNNSNDFNSQPIKTPTNNMQHAQNFNINKTIN